MPEEIDHGFDAVQYRFEIVGEADTRENAGERADNPHRHAGNREDHEYLPAGKTERFHDTDVASVRAHDIEGGDDDADHGGDDEEKDDHDHDRLFEAQRREKVTLLVFNGADGV